MAQFKLENRPRKKCGICFSYVADISEVCERCEKLKIQLGISSLGN